MVKTMTILSYRSYKIDFDGLNYILRKQGTAYKTTLNPTYHSSLENALIEMYENILLSHVKNRKKNYGSKIKQLAELITESKREVIDACLLYTSPSPRD